MLMRKYSSSLVIRKTNTNKNKVRYNYNPIRMGEV